MLHLPSLFLAIVLVSATLAVAVGLVAERRQRDGMFLWAAGLLAHTLAYALFGLRGVVPDALSVVLANGLLAATFALFGESLCQFHGRRPPRLLLWVPVPVTLALFLVLVDALQARLTVGPLIYAAQLSVLLALLLAAWRSTVGRGQYFLFAGLLLLLPMLVVRAAIAVGGAVELATFRSSGLSQSLTFVVVLSSTLLTTLGFVLMGKERADHRNRQLAMLDDLTGLPNRRHTLQALAQQAAQARRGVQSLTLLMVDVDHFKRVNDEHGHLVGDAVLRHVARTLRGRLRDQDLLGRFGGEEFLAILPGTAAHGGGLVLAEALRAAVAERGCPVAGTAGLALTISVGVAELPAGAELGTDSLICAADQAMYRAKAGGRNRVEPAGAADYALADKYAGSSAAPAPTPAHTSGGPSLA